MTCYTLSVLTRVTLLFLGRPRTSARDPESGAEFFFVLTHMPDHTLFLFAPGTGPGRSRVVSRSCSCITAGPFFFFVFCIVGLDAKSKEGLGHGCSLLSEEPGEGGSDGGDRGVRVAPSP